MHHGELNDSSAEISCISIFNKLAISMNQEAGASLILPLHIPYAEGMGSTFTIQVCSILAGSREGEICRSFQLGCPHIQTSAPMTLLEFLALQLQKSLYRSLAVHSQREGSLLSLPP